MKKIFAMAAVLVFSVVLFAGKVSNEKVTICHVPPGNPENAHAITISINAVPHHFANHEGDALGDCDDPTNE